MNHSLECERRSQLGIRHHGDPVNCECECDCHGDVKIELWV